MTREQQRIAIAETCGWKCGIAKGKANWHPEKRGYSTDQSKVNGLPDYLNDLNAMHEAEIAAGFDSYPLRERYYPNIIEAKDKDRSGLPMWMATAAQRAEAYLKTKGLWK